VHHERKSWLRLCAAVTDYLSMCILQWQVTGWFWFRTYQHVAESQHHITLYCYTHCCVCNDYCWR